MKVNVVLFDLDGTITDSAPGIVNSIRYALEKRGMEILPEPELRGFIGPPLKERFQEVFSVTEEESVQMVELYREYYGEKGIFENRVYDGVMEMLRQLKDAGIRLLIATAKPEGYANIIAQHFGFGKYFDFIGGACMDGSRTDKYEVIEYVLDSCGIEDRESVIMVGDRSHDMIGAKKAGIHSLGILYGYGARTELEGAGAELIAQTPREAAEMILRL